MIARMRKSVNVDVISLTPESARLEIRAVDSDIRIAIAVFGQSTQLVKADLPN
jgi:hypothetical protein